MLCAEVTDERISEVNVLTEIIDIRHGFKTCDVLSYYAVNYIANQITIFYVFLAK